MCSFELNAINDVLLVDVEFGEGWTSAVVAPSAPTDLVFSKLSSHHISMWGGTSDWIWIISECIVPRVYSVWNESTLK